jgi:RNA polymerase sigma-70 factor (ECF subfamily)
MIFADEEVAIEVASRDNESLQSKNLVAAARSGSSAAFAELREIYAPRVYRKLVTMTKNREDAEDALQDTFLRAYMALHTFEERSSFYTWVTRIAINSALMILRRRRTRSEVSFDSPGETEEAISGFEFKDTGPSPEHICVHRQRYACMLRHARNSWRHSTSIVAVQDSPISVLNIAWYRWGSCHFSPRYCRTNAARALSVVSISSIALS